jgi:hypothetical protein
VRFHSRDNRLKGDRPCRTTGWNDFRIGRCLEMLIRALSLATVTLLIGGAAAPALAQNLEAGKTASQIFADTCTACHRSPRGLLKTLSPGSLQGFLRQHYTTSGEMASQITAFLMSNGAADTRHGGARQAKDAKWEAKPEQSERSSRRSRANASHDEATRPDDEPAAKPDIDEPSPQGESRHHGRAAGRLEEAPDAAKPGAPAAASEHGKPSKRSRLSREEPPRIDARHEEEPKIDAGQEELPKAGAPREESAKGETVKNLGEQAPKEEAPKSETAKVESGETESAKPSGEDKSAGIEPTTEPGGPPALRPDPVPPVTPAPPASQAVSASMSGGTSEPASEASVPAAPAASPAVTASVPQPAAPVAPAGPPAPPISR